MKLHQLRQRLRDAGAGPSHEQRILRNWSHALVRESGRRRPSTFFPAPLLAALPGIEAELADLARLRTAHAAIDGMRLLTIGELGRAR